MIKTRKIKERINDIYFNYFVKDGIHKNRLSKMKKAGIEYGVNLRCFSNIIGNEPYLITIGDNVTISSDVKIITHDNSVIKLDCIGTDIIGKVNIGNNCFIGLGSLILPGVTLSDNIIVGAGSVVTKSFYEQNIIIAGNPARKICTIEEFKLKNKDYIHDMKGLDFQLKKNYILNLNDNRFIKR